jgi:Na+-transporting methylmalonyl-CoA/oxaloacetate decarboxylase gamma subunit
MDNPIVVSLFVSGIGMLMLFVALTLLYGLMYLMTWITGLQAPAIERPDVTAGRGEGDEQGAEGTEREARNRKRQAAVIAVALARAELDLSPIGASGAEGAGPSAWWALHHQRQLIRSVPKRGVR